MIRETRNGAGSLISCGTVCLPFPYVIFWIHLNETGNLLMRNTVLDGMLSK